MPYPVSNLTVPEYPIIRAVVRVLLCVLLTELDVDFRIVTGFCFDSHRVFNPNIYSVSTISMGEIVGFVSPTLRFSMVTGSIWSDRSNWNIFEWKYSSAS